MNRILCSLSGAFSALSVLTSCGPSTYALDVELRQPSASGLDLGGKAISVVFLDNGVSEDSLFSATFSQSFAERMDKEYFGGDSLVQVFSLRTRPGAEYSSRDTMINLLTETNADVLFLMDTLHFGQVSASLPADDAAGRSFVEASFPYSVTLYVYDAMYKGDKVFEFSGSKMAKSCTYLTGNESGEERFRMLKENLVSEAKSSGSASASSFLAGWESERFIFYIFDSDAWYESYYAVQEYRWKEAMDIWMSMLDTKNLEKKACLEYNLAVACYIQGQYSLAKEWIELSAKDFDLPFTKRVSSMIQSKL